MKLKDQNPLFISFLQASLTALYISFVGYLMWNAETLFGPLTSFAGPILFLTLFVTSALFLGLIVFGYPILLFWEFKKHREALLVVTYTTAWLVMYFFGILILIFS